jgi:hypothetical protein
MEGIAKAVESLPKKHETLHSNPRTTKKKSGEGGK